MKINFHNNTDYDIKPFKKIIKKAFKSIKGKGSIEIIFMTPLEIKELNNSFRNINKSTDVLSFPNDDESIKSFGDIFINIDQAIIQAKEYKHSLDREIAFLSVHGYLHLIGYDHQTIEEEKEMFKLQEEILQKAKIKREQTNE